MEARWSISILSPYCFLCLHVLTAELAPFWDWPMQSWVWGKAMFWHTECVFHLMSSLFGPGEKLPIPLRGFFWMQPPQCRPWISFGHPLHVQDMPTLGGLIIPLRCSSCLGPEVAPGEYYFFQVQQLDLWEILIHPIIDSKWGVVHSLPTCNCHSQSTTKGSHWFFSCPLDFLV